MGLRGRGRLPGRAARSRAGVRHAPHRLARGPRLREGMARRCSETRHDRGADGARDRRRHRWAGPRDGAPQGGDRGGRVRDVPERARTASAARSPSRRTGSTRCASSAPTATSAPSGGPSITRSWPMGAGASSSRSPGSAGSSRVRRCGGPTSTARCTTAPPPTASRSSTAGAWSPSTRRRDGVTARFADGTTATADVLVGADGIRSTVRTLIDPAAPGPRHVPLLNVGGSAGAAPPARPDAAHFVFGRRAFLGWWHDRDGGTAWFANVPTPSR